ncbi:MAG: hypothetical protein BGO67_01035 [Alphaproteobacteria bacterium 41-28]|nr:MAG: hypothetical protein BGO67_01035 [Alphaproteobacteria bacterium 41-28]
MLKKSLLTMLVTALVFSSSDVVFAMEENRDCQTPHPQHPSSFSSDSDIDDEAKTGLTEGDKQTPHSQPTVAFFTDSNADVEKRAILPSELQVLVLSFIPGEELLTNLSLASRHSNELVKSLPLQKIIISQTFPKGKLAKTMRNLSLFNGANEAPIDESDAKFFIDRFQEALIKHMEYGFTHPFIAKIFNADIIKQAMQTGAGIYVRTNCVARCFPLKILATQPEEGHESSTASAAQPKSLKRELTALFERHPAFQEYDQMFSDTFHHINYESHFNTIFRFMEGMTEEQQAKAISLLSPHLTAENFGNFYPGIFIDGFTHNLAYINGDLKIKWLSRKLEDCAYFPESM